VLRVRAWVCALALAVSGPAFAHKLKVFAAAEGTRILGSTYFAGGSAAGGVRVEVRDAQGRVLAQLAPDPEGHFAYTAEAPIDHVVVALTGDGHQASWTVSSTELAGAFPESAPQQAHPAPQPPAGGAPAAAVRAPGNVPDPQVLAAIEAAVARQVRPLREELAADRDRARLHDILGGIGYILGIAGLALWWGTRRRDRARGGPA
jgi:nickel transport protein